jgi:hypothetical protein
VTQSAKTIRLAGIELDRARHIWPFFNSDEEEGTLLPFTMARSEAFLKELQQRRAAVKSPLKSAI